MTLLGVLVSISSLIVAYVKGVFRKLWSWIRRIPFNPSDITESDVITRERSDHKSSTPRPEKRKLKVDDRRGQFPRLVDMAIRMLLHLGVRIGPTCMLTVRGRKSGKPRTTPVDIFEMDGNRYIIALHGVGNWVHNIRVAGTGALSRGGNSEAIRAVELTSKEAAPILKARLEHAPSFVRRRFSATALSLDVLENEATYHPVFKLDKAEDRDVLRVSES
jgi:deazaflavin-dependent oxidoreductase (nitroreductase family)